MIDSPGVELRAHTRRRLLSFWLRAAGLRVARFARDFRKARRRLASIPRLDFGTKHAVSVRSLSGLYAGEGITGTERLWQMGKVENLRLALRGIDGVVVPEGEVFSFWRQVGPPWSFRGFVTGREVREGCLIPAIGGGLCQLSNALYDCALKAGCEIVERHAHTQRVPGSLAEINRDATVFWNYVDLQFRARHPLRISAKLTAQRLEVCFQSEACLGAPREAAPPTRPTGSAVENCATCGIESCRRHTGPGWGAGEETHVLVDEWWPEFDDWLGRQERDRWRLSVPMRRSRWRRSNYNWRDEGWRSVRDVPGLALLRAWRSRRLAAQGAERQRALLGFDRALAGTYARHLSWRGARVIVTQALLPHLHASGALGGRSCTVWLTRAPIRLLQERLDAAAALHPASSTLTDFRADAFLADSEWEALEQAESLVTCHARLAGIWPEKTILLPWSLPASRPARPAGRETLVVFPASGVARKGAYEMRAALRELGLPLRVAGASQLEGDGDFWRGVRLAAPAAHWLDGASVVVLPAWVENRPRRLLEAIAAGVPVIASDACGLHHWPAHRQVSIVPCGDVSRLIAEIAAAVKPSGVIAEPVL